MKRLIFTLALLPTFWTPAAHAQDAPLIPRAQTQAFAAAYTLRMCDLRAQGFVHSVKALKDMDDDQTAGAEVAQLSHQATNLRKRQAASYRQVSLLLAQMGAPEPLRHWAAQTADVLAAPLVYGDDAKSLMKTEPDTAATLAELGEIQTIKAQADAHLPSFTTWLKLTGGRLSVWTNDVGAYAADLHAATHETLPLGTAKELLLNAPEGAPSEVRGDLSELVPRGGGNLQNLATIAPANVTPQKMSVIAEKLIAAYNAHALTAEANNGD